ncbi:MAG: hypothetical protein A3K05_00145 [Candidatus Doudnabacteria bacterium RIFCSPHIGHO2_01_48_18]|nr:MAG: hypothetical protein A3K05_00145 [Candidatus Doudnabacteria bacterium RIFCSPHIGHO2_01_48_18]
MKFSRGFAPHEFGKRVEIVSGAPRVLFTRDAFQDNSHLVDICPAEVGWMGHVRRVGNDFLIHRIFLVEQEVSGSTCELDSEALAGYAVSCLSEPDGEELFNSIRFWGHSHANMGTSPSGQDESQLHDLANRGGDFFLRGIFNKLGRAEFTIALPSAGIWLRDAEWQVVDEVNEARKAHWQNLVSEKVREKVFVSQFSSEFYGRNWRNGDEPALPAPATSRLVFSGGPETLKTKGGRKKWERKS